MAAGHKVLYYHFNCRNTKYILKSTFVFFHIVKVNWAGVVLNKCLNIFQNTFFYAAQRKRKIWNDMRLSK